MAASVPHRSSKNAAVQNAGIPAYYRVGWGAAGQAGTESTIQINYRTAGVASLMMVKLQTNDRAASTMNFRKNTANGNMNIVTSTAGTFTDTTNLDSIVSGDVVNYLITTGAGGTTFIARLFSIIFKSNDPALTMSKTNNAPLDFTTASTSIFTSISSSAWNTTGEGEAQHPARTTMTIKNLYDNVTVWTRSTNTTIGSRKNTANGNLVVTVSAVATYEDTTNSDSIVAGDLIDLYHTNGTGAGSCTSQSLGVELVSTNNQAEYASTTSTGGGQGASAGNTAWQGFGGFYGVIATTETDIQMNIGTTLVASNMSAYVHANSWSVGSPKFDFRKNTANGNQTKAITLGVDGLYEDTINSDSLVPADIINLQYVAGSTGAGALNGAGMKMDMSISPTTTPFFGTINNYVGFGF